MQLIGLYSEGKPKGIEGTSINQIWSKQEVAGLSARGVAR